MNKKIIIGSALFIILGILTAVLLTGGFDLSVTSGSTTVNTGIKCSSINDCIENPDLEEIKDILVCDNTCKFSRVTDGGILNE